MKFFGRNTIRAVKDPAILLLGFFCLVVSGCSPLRIRNAPPATANIIDAVVGFHEIRAWANDPEGTIRESLVKSVVQESARSTKLDDRVSVLALSGGGADGAFGAGLLNGWTKTGLRPKFKIVTGISTGALIAPFAFLGSGYDSELKEVYTTFSTGDLLKLKKILKILRGDSIGDDSGFIDVASRYFDREMMKEIAIEHAKGRRLFIGTTNLDAQRAVVWDIGAIATVGGDEALELFRKVLVASASIPVVFPPVYMDVEVDGEIYEEMHVDGGVLTQVFVYGSDVVADPLVVEGSNSTRKRRPIDLYVIRNGKLDPAYEQIGARISPIALRSIRTLIKSQGTGDIFHLLLLSVRDQMNFRLSYIPSEFSYEKKEEFDTEYMGSLFDAGHAMGLDASHWKDGPPGFQEFDYLKQQSPNPSE